MIGWCLVSGGGFPGVLGVLFRVKLGGVVGDCFASDWRVPFLTSLFWMQERVLQFAGLLLLGLALPFLALVGVCLVDLIAD